MQHLFLSELIHRCARQVVKDTESTVCSSIGQEAGEMIQDNENAFSFRGQTVFIISHNHSWLPFIVILALLFLWTESS